MFQPQKTTASFVTCAHCVLLNQCRCLFRDSRCHDFVTGNNNAWCEYGAVSCRQSDWIDCYDQPSKPLMISS